MATNEGESLVSVVFKFIIDSGQTPFELNKFIDVFDIFLNPSPLAHSHVIFFFLSIDKLQMKYAWIEILHGVRQLVLVGETRLHILTLDTCQTFQQGATHADSLEVHRINFHVQLCHVHHPVSV